VDNTPRPISNDSTAVIERQRIQVRPVTCVLYFVIEILPFRFRLTCIETRTQTMYTLTGYSRGDASHSSSQGV
jgi:hypothetical protein